MPLIVVADMFQLAGGQFGESFTVVAAKLDAIKALVASGDLTENVNYVIKAEYLLPILKSIDGFPMATAFAGWSKQGQAVSGLQPFAVLITVY